MRGKALTTTLLLLNFYSFFLLILSLRTSVWMTLCSDPIICDPAKWYFHSAGAEELIKDVRTSLNQSVKKRLRVWDSEWCSRSTLYYSIYSPSQHTLSSADDWFQFSIALTLFAFLIPKGYHVFIKDNFIKTVQDGRNYNNILYCT